MWTQMLRHKVCTLFLHFSIDLVSTISSSKSPKEISMRPQILTLNTLQMHQPSFGALEPIWLALKQFRQTHITQTSTLQLFHLTWHLS